MSKAMRIRGSLFVVVMVAVSLGLTGCDINVDLSGLLSSIFPPIISGVTSAIGGLLGNLFGGGSTATTTVNISTGGTQAQNASPADASKIIENSDKE